MQIIAGYLQYNPKFGKTRQNVEKALTMIHSSDADLLVLPELFNTGYQFTSVDEARELSEPIPSGFTTQKLLQLSRDRSIFIVAGIAERSGNRVYNSAVMMGPQGYIGKYRKIHLFSEEKMWFSPGDAGFNVWQTPVGNIGIMICFDWFFPESARTLALKGADIIAHPANLVLPYCPDAMVTRCLENRVFSITANRTGEEKRKGKTKLTFIGNSEIVSPRGKILSRASATEEKVSFVEIETEDARKKDLNEFNNLFEDRKEIFYFSSSS